MTKKKEANYDFLNDAMNGDAGGFEDINSQTMSVPFIRILQTLSPQLKASKPEYIEGATAGQLFNTVNSNLYNSPIKVVIGKFERYYIEWGKERGKYLGAHAPEHVEITLQDKLIRNEKNKLVDPTTGSLYEDTYVYYVVLPDHVDEGICIISLSSTAIKEAKKLNRNMLHTIIPNTKQRALPYFMIWNMELVEMSNDQGDWWSPRFTFDSFVTPDLLAGVVEEREALPNKTVDLAQLAAPIIDNDEGDGDGQY